MINKAIRSLLVSSALWYLGESMLGPFFAVFAQKIGGSILDISGAWTVYLIVTGILVIIVGKISDTLISKERLLIAGYFLNCIFTFAYIFIKSPFELFIVQAGLGVSAALATPTWSALFARHESKKNDGFDWGLAGGSTYLVNAVAVFTGGIIINYFSFNVLFFTMGVVQVVSAIYVAWKFRAPQKSSVKKVAKHKVKHPHFAHSLHKRRRI